MTEVTSQALYIGTRRVRAPVAPLCLSRVTGFKWLGIHLTKAHSAFHPYGVDKSSTSFGWGYGGECSPLSGGR